MTKAIYLFLGVPLGILSVWAVYDWKRRRYLNQTVKRVLRAGY